MFYFDSNTCLPLKCPELALWKADVDRMTFGRLFLLFPHPVKNTFSISHVLYLFSLKATWISSNNTRVQILYFDSNTTVPLKCVALVVWKAYVEIMSFGFFHALIKLIAS